MARKKKYRAQVETVHEEEREEQPVSGWGGGWDQSAANGWGQGGLDQNGWQNQNAQNAPDDVQPGDSISNASFDNSDRDRDSVAPTPPIKEAPMATASNAAWGWGTGPLDAVAQTTARNRNSSVRNSSVNDIDSARGMQNMLRAIIEQRQGQEKELTEQLRHQLQHAEGMAYVNPKRGRQGRHQRESSWGGARGQTSEVGTSHSHSHHGPAETRPGEAWDGAWGMQQNGNGNFAEGSRASSNPKSKKRKSKSGDQQPKGDGQTVNGWGNATGESAWGTKASGWGSSVTPGGFGAKTSETGWGTNTKDVGWVDKENFQAPGLAESHSWCAWTDSNQPVGQNKPPKVTITAPDSIGEVTILSSRSQSGLSGFFSRIFRGRNKKKKDKGKQKEIDADPWAQENEVRHEKKRKEKRRETEKETEYKEQGKKGKTLKKQKFAEPEATTWPSHENDHEDEDDSNGGRGNWEDVGGGGGWDDPAPAQASRVSDGWSNSPYPKTSRTYAYATEGMGRDARRSRGDDHSTDHRILDSKRQALVPARTAFYSRERLARDRIFWFFDPNNDVRVSAMLDWIQFMQVPLATFGFENFLESRERGALFTNIEYRVPTSPQEPAFDWITYDAIQPTMDRILQESVAAYDPSSQILVFVFLLSKSRRSMAIWRRKLPLPENIRLTHGTQITKDVGNLNKKYPIHVDEASASNPRNINPAANKKGWLAWGRP